MSTLSESTKTGRSTVVDRVTMAPINRNRARRARVFLEMARQLVAFVALLLVGAVSLTACESPMSDSEATYEELHAFNDRFNEIAARYDIEGFLSLYSDATLWIEPAALPVEGLEMPRATFQFLTENEGMLTHTVDHLFVSEDRTQAVMIGQADILVENAELDATGNYLFVLERIGEDWKIVTDMFHQHTEQ